MQEYMLDSYLVYKTGRINVFDNYTWDRYGWDYGYRDGVVVPSRVPLTAMIAGPLVGDPFPIDDPVPPTVLVDYFQQVCPKPTVVNTGDIANELSESIRADELIQIWTENINAMQDRCIEIDRNSGRIFSWGIFGDASRLLDVWPEYKASPIIQNFRWSDLVESAFDTNLHLFSSTDKDKTMYPYTTVNELLALHIRRGDYVSHCDELAQNAVEWNGFNAFPRFPDQWKIPTGCGDGEATLECREVYRKSCYPTVQQIVAKVEEICSTSVGQGLKNVFIMTNGETRWVEELKEALAKVRKWEKISSTLDMKLSHEQTYIDQAIDMLIGQRAQVVIGNGWSSLTSNIVMLRMARDAPPESNRFW
ncbi:hypothetical protein C8Q75DRAFT_718257 [Abortiporus biennis]|nr:hypothetical protein C8Q75DRAFT_718257 [Abortiporus biennis]